MRMICTVCGTVLETQDAEGEEVTVCPICGVGKDAFEQDVSETEL